MFNFSKCCPRISKLICTKQWFHCVFQPIHLIHCLEFLLLPGHQIWYLHLFLIFTFAWVISERRRVLISLPHGLGSFLFSSNHLMSVYHVPRNCARYVSCTSRSRWVLNIHMNVWDWYRWDLARFQTAYKILTISTQPLIFPNPKELLTTKNPSRVFVKYTCVLVRV